MEIYISEILGEGNKFTFKYFISMMSIFSVKVGAKNQGMSGLVILAVNTGYMYINQGAMLFIYFYNI